MIQQASQPNSAAHIAIGTPTAPSSIQAAEPMTMAPTHMNNARRRGVEGPVKLSPAIIAISLLQWREC
jgi:hypothetical protein